MSQEDVRAASGLSVTTIGKVERGDHDLVVQPATLRRLDLALRWPVGTAESWYAGRGGIVTGGSDAAPSGLARIVEELAPMVAAQLRAEAQQSTLSVAGLPDDIVAALEQLLRAVRNYIVHGRP